MRNELVVDVRVVRKSVQRHESRPAAWKVPDIQAFASVLNPVLGKSWKGRALGAIGGGGSGASPSPRLGSLLFVAVFTSCGCPSRVSLNGPVPSSPRSPCSVF